MADNLNVANDPQLGGTNSPINDAPTKSPLEESVPADNGSTGMASPDMGMPPVSPEPAPMGQVPAAEPAPSIPPAPATEGLGESSTPPNTDEFLNSILQQQPQGSVAGSTEGDMNSMSTPPAPSIQTESAPPLNTPLEPKEPEMNMPNSPLPTPTSEVAMESQIPQTPTPPAPTMPEMSSTPEPMQNAFAPATPAPTIQDGVSLDGVQTAPAAPEPPQTTDAPVSSNVFSQPPKGGSGGMKKIILAVLALIVIGGGYYAYAMFAGGSGTTNTAAKTKTATASKVAGVTASSPNDTQRKTDLGVIRDALMNYYSGSNQYPVSADIVMLNVTGNVLEQALVPQYLAKLPTDPDTTKAYGYKSDGMSFTLSAVLDNTSDSEAVMESGKAIYKLTNSSSASSTTNVSASGTTINTPVASSTSATYPPVPGAVDDAQTATSTTGSSTGTTPVINSNF